MVHLSMIALEVMQTAEVLGRSYNSAMTILGFLTIENPNTSILFSQRFWNIPALHITVLNLNPSVALALQTKTSILLSGVPQAVRCTSCKETISMSVLCTYEYYR
ncbi:hypothetical protein C922_05374 [Plasmodium inui San Antonio 1]|uniref:Uncharacterized protein n=1 Tax=Plasmodium inui San Antonio 1 TaxID=1237626 RepID=W6ZY57_9APIC|nr:hypothetical protein C922_05374 [Plasmodium inui San Antonio 1]EUD64243.1 hypothetical protein C922_05374 [Plasmodium inui San Antonio 1]